MNRSFLSSVNSSNQRIGVVQIQQDIPQGFDSSFDCKPNKKIDNLDSKTKLIKQKLYDEYKKQKAQKDAQSSFYQESSIDDQSFDNGKKKNQYQETISPVKGDQKQKDLSYSLDNSFNPPPIKNYNQNQSYLDQSTISLIGAFNEIEKETKYQKQEQAPKQISRPPTHPKSKQKESKVIIQVSQIDNDQSFLDKKEQKQSLKINNLPETSFLGEKMQENQINSGIGSKKQNTSKTKGMIKAQSLARKNNRSIAFGNNSSRRDDQSSYKTFSKIGLSQSGISGIGRMKSQQPKFRKGFNDQSISKISINSETQFSDEKSQSQILDKTIISKAEKAEKEREEIKKIMNETGITKISLAKREIKKQKEIERKKKQEEIRLQRIRDMQANNQRIELSQRFKDRIQTVQQAEKSPPGAISSFFSNLFGVCGASKPQDKNEEKDEKRQGGCFGNSERQIEVASEADKSAQPIALNNQRLLTQNSIFAGEDMSQYDSLGDAMERRKKARGSLRRRKQENQSSRQYLNSHLSSSDDEKQKKQQSESSSSEESSSEDENRNIHKSIYQTYRQKSLIQDSQQTKKQFSAIQPQNKSSQHRKSDISLDSSSSDDLQNFKHIAKEIKKQKSKEKQKEIKIQKQLQSDEEKSIIMDEDDYIDRKNREKNREIKDKIEQELLYQRKMSQKKKEKPKQNLKEYQPKDNSSIIPKRELGLSDSKVLKNHKSYNYSPIKHENKEDSGIFSKISSGFGHERQNSKVSAASKKKRVQIVEDSSSSDEILLTDQSVVKKQNRIQSDSD